MRRATVCVIACALLCLAGVAEAQIVSPFHLIPVVAKVAGAAGTDWMTSMNISNVSSGGVRVTATFYRENTNNTPFAGPSHSFNMAAGQTMTVNDVLGSWFSGQGNTKGFLILTAEPTGGGDEANLAVTGRIFNNANPNATYGQSVSSNLFAMMYGTGSSVLTGARWDGTSRSNVGVVNLGHVPLEVLITIYNANGAVVASVTKTVSTFSMAQWSIQQLGVSNLSPGGRVEVTVDPDSIMWDPCDPTSWGFGTGYAVFMAYISKVDQATGDGEFAFGQNDWTNFVFDCDVDPGDPCLKSAIGLP